MYSSIDATANDNGKGKDDSNMMSHDGTSMDIASDDDSEQTDGKQESLQGPVWSKSQFAKVDLLGAALHQSVEKKQEHLNQKDKKETERIRLPFEILMHIFDIFDHKGKLGPEHLRICRDLYWGLLPKIYCSPKLKSRNFASFMDTVVSSKHVGNLVKELDLSYIIQGGKNASVARLLKRTKENLELFVAPQASFGFGPLIALKNCKKLRILDLRLVSEKLNLEELFLSLSNLHDLTHLSFPRSSVELNDLKGITWPTNLSFLRLSGGITDDFLLHCDFPLTITHLEFAHCPHITDTGFQCILEKLGRNLKALRVQYPMPKLKSNSLDSVLIVCPFLVVLEVAVDYVSSTFFDEENLSFLPFLRPLRTLYIESSGLLGTSTRIHPIDLAVAINEDRLPCLKNLRCTAKLGWNPDSDYVSYIAEKLEERGGGLYIGY